MGRQMSNLFVDLKGHCFLCLEQILPRIEHEPEVKAHSLHPLSRYIDMAMGKALKDKGLVLEPSLLAKVERSKLKVELCKDCASLTEKFSKLCQQLEQIEMKVNSSLHHIRGKLLKVKEAEHVPNLSDVECELNFSDGDGVMRNLELVEILRTEAMEKCSHKLKTINPRVKLDKLVWINEEDMGMSPRNSSFEFNAKIEVTNLEVKQEPVGHSEYYDSFAEDSDSELLPVEDRESETNQLEKDCDTDLMECDICHEKVRDLSTHVFTTHYESEEGPNEEPVPVEVVTKVSTVPAAPLCNINPKTGKHKCGICSKELLNKYTFQTHYKIAHLQVRYKCSLCEKQFVNQSLFNYHYQAVHLRIKKFQQRRAKTPPKSFKCPICKKGFTQKGNMQAHVNAVHLKLREHECEFCGKKFKQKGHVKSHQRRKHRNKME